MFSHRHLELHSENSDKYSGTKCTHKVSINCISKRLCHSASDTKTDGSPSQSFRDKLYIDRELELDSNRESLFSVVKMLN